MKIKFMLEEKYTIDELSELLNSITLRLDGESIERAEILSKRIPLAFRLKDYNGLIKFSRTVENGSVYSEKLFYYSEELFIYKGKSLGY